MKITFIMGNGFDIGLGLHTSYENFYDQYCVIQDDDNNNIKSFKTMLKNRNYNKDKRIIDWADFEKAFGQHSEDFSLESKWDYIERFEHFVMSFNRYLEDEEKKADYSNKEKITETMKKGVTTYFHIRPADRETIQAVYNRSSSVRTYNFISFNYTRTVDQCAQILKESLKNDNSRNVDKALHVHGYVEENMIMGVNDPTQITKTEFAKDVDVIREIVKPQQNSDVRANYEKGVLSTINSSDVICVYGMSIGDTDKKWWNIIAKWLSKSSNRALVIMKYDKKYNPRFPFSQNRFVDEVVNKFISLSEQPESVVADIRSRIFVGMNHNVFEMNLRQEEPDAQEIFFRAVRAGEQAQRLINDNPDIMAALAAHSKVPSLMGED